MNRQTLKILLLPFLLACLLAGIYCMPRHGDPADCSISMELPTGHQLSGWYGTRKQESQEERDILAVDTEFSKADYVQQFPISIYSPVHAPARCHVSIVKSGHDLNNSIHRPERCLPAQGHFNLTSQKISIPVEGHGILTMTQLKSQQNVAPNNEKPVILDSMHYYIFIGHKHLTADHIQRTMLDMKDRVLYGRDQRWSYFQISTSYGPLINLPEEEARKNTEKLISQLLAQLIQWEEISH